MVSLYNTQWADVVAGSISYRLIKEDNDTILGNKVIGKILVTWKIYSTYGEFHNCASKVVDNEEQAELLKAKLLLRTR